MSDTDIKADLLKDCITRRFEIDKTFVDISAVGSDDVRKIYRCNVQLETTENSLKKFHLSIYTFYLEAGDETGFKYENVYYSYAEINTFLSLLERQIKGSGRK